MSTALLHFTTTSGPPAGIWYAGTIGVLLSHYDPPDAEACAYARALMRVKGPTLKWLDWFEQLDQRTSHDPNDFTHTQLQPDETAAAALKRIQATF